MDDKRLLIVGIDPGITTAYAVLDIEGSLIHLKSSKQLDLNHLISEIIKQPSHYSFYVMAIMIILLFINRIINKHYL